MNLRKWGLVAFAFALGFVGANPASADTLQIEQSGRTLHAAVCPHGNPHGTARCHAHVVVDARGNIINGKPDNLSPRATPSGYGPNDLRTAYALASASASNGAGKVIAIVDAYGYTKADSDLQAYRSQYGLPACTVANGCLIIRNQTGGTSLPRMDTGWAQEQALDLDMASAICPNCKILLVQATSNSFANLAAGVDYAASYPGVVAISNSYGGSEYSGEVNDQSHYNNPTTRSIAVTVSSGDNGYGVEFPAASQSATAVGGTHLIVGQPESAWSGAGSGCSAYIAKPSYQHDTGCARRAVADVSAVADPNTGVAVYGPVNRSASGWMVFGGTSVAAPLIAGVYAVSGSVVPLSTTYGNAGGLHDVASGSNGSCGGTYLCTSVTGYDGPTGNGTPNGTSAF
jgi:subtilase family serine protease